MSDDEESIYESDYESEDGIESSNDEAVDEVAENTLVSEEDSLKNANGLSNQPFKNIDAMKTCLEMSEVVDNVYESCSRPRDSCTTTLINNGTEKLEVMLLEADYYINAERLPVIRLWCVNNHDESFLIRLVVMELSTLK